MCIEKDEWPGGHPKTTEVPAKLLRSISRAELCSEHIHYADQNKVYQSMITMLGMPFRFRSVTERTGRYTRKLAAVRSPRAPSASRMNNQFEELRLHRQQNMKGLFVLLCGYFRASRSSLRGPSYTKCRLQSNCKLSKLLQCRPSINTANFPSSLQSC